MMFLDCPAYLDRNGAARCGLPAEVTCRYTLNSTDGPLEGAMIRCPAGHYFNGPVEFLALDRPSHPGPRPAGLGSRADRDDLRSGLPRQERKVRLPSTAPAYYLGRPAALWLSATRPHHERAAIAVPEYSVRSGLM
jgi:hypothetical protein